MGNPVRFSFSTSVSSPEVNQRYRQEYYEDEAEDWVEVLSLTESVSVVYGSYENCLQTLE